MMEFFVYSLQSGICLFSFFLLYKAAFQHLSLHTWNRSYLLLATCASLLMPLVQLPEWTSTEPVVIEWEQNYLEAIDSGYIQAVLKEEKSKEGYQDAFNLWLLTKWVYLFGVLFQSTLLLKKIWGINRMIVKSCNIERVDGIKVHYLDRLSTPFSFFNHIFLHKALQGKEKACIVAHEKGHAKRLHSYDILVLEVIRCVFWWNPLWRRITTELAKIHEYQVDREVSKIFSAQAYALLLLKLSQNNFSVPVASHFANVSLKNRIIMIKKNQHEKQQLMSARIRFLWVAPLIAFLIFGFSNPIAFKQIIPQEEAKAKPLNYLLPPKPIEIGIPSILPLERNAIGKVTAKFGMFMHPIAKVRKHHAGIDFSAPIGTPIFATAAGKVLISEEEKNWGKRIVIQHEDGLETHYAHMSELLVEKGETVRQGMQIGKVGSSGLSTGPHLHYAVRLNKKYVDPMDYFAEVQDIQSINGI